MFHVHDCVGRVNSYSPLPLLFLEMKMARACVLLHGGRFLNVNTDTLLTFPFLCPCKIRPFNAPKVKRKVVSQAPFFFRGKLLVPGTGVFAV